MAMSEQPALAVAANPDQSPYVDWPAIIAGTVFASAISFVLLTFGSAIGLSLSSAYEGEGMSLAGFSIAAALWLLWVQLSGFMAGGYLTGRMRRRHFDATEHESDIRDGIHGLAVWGLGILLGAMVALSGVSAAVSTATSAIGSVAAGATVGAAANVDTQVSPYDPAIDRLLRQSAAPVTSGAAASASEGAQPTSVQPGSDDANRAEIGRLLTTSLESGTLADADKSYLAQLVSARSSVNQAQAEKRVNDFWAEAQKVEQDARAAADKARRTGVIAAFITAAALLVSAAGAYFGATLGGNHRDKQVVFSQWTARP